MAAQEELCASELLVGPAQSMLLAEELLRRGTAPVESELPIPRAMVVMAHPDDETIALGARMQRFSKATFVHVTDGAPRNEEDSRAHGFKNINDYREVREQELSAMFRRAGLLEASQVSLNFPDQEASFSLAEITRKIANLIALHEPEIIFTHPYEGGHPDHDACAFASHHAVEINRGRGGGRPLILESPFYHAGPDGFESGTFLRKDECMPEISYELSDTEMQDKQRLTACFATQKETLKGFCNSREQFRIAPVYDFARPPHAGKVLYERYPWGMSSGRFCQLAEQAQAELDHNAVRQT